MTAAVSRETSSPDEGGHCRRYRCPRFEARRAEVRKALIDAVIALAAEGDFRAEAAEIAKRAGVSRRQIVHHFGSVVLLYRVVARERWYEVHQMAGIPAGGTADSVRALVWMVLVGKPKDIV